jgi:hypothetical protein
MMSIFVVIDTDFAQSPLPFPMVMAVLALALFIPHPL